MNEEYTVIIKRQKEQKVNDTIIRNQTQIMKEMEGWILYLECGGPEWGQGRFRGWEQEWSKRRDRRRSRGSHTVRYDEMLRYVI